MTPFYSEPGIELYCGDCRTVLPVLPADSIDTVITDPPYGLSFMGKAWDYGVPSADVWREVLRVCKPGAMMLAFGGTRTFHRLACAIEDAGWDIRDCIVYMYGSGFPKSHNFGCKCRGNTVPYDHEKQAKSEAEYDLRSVRDGNVSASFNDDEKCGKVLLQSVSEQGTSELRGEGSKPEIGGTEQSGLEGRKLYRTREGVSDDSDAGPSKGEGERVCAGAHSDCGKEVGPRTKAGGRSSPQERSAPRQQAKKSNGVPGSQFTLDSESSENGDRCTTCGGVKTFTGYGSALKPAWEPIIVAMKPLDGTFAENAQRHGVAGLNIDGGRIKANGRPLRIKEGVGPSVNCYGDGHNGSRAAGETSLGRWPANVLLDEEAAKQLDEVTCELKGGASINHNRIDKTNAVYGKYGVVTEDVCYGDSGGASRFFYTAKASRSDRGHSNNHPTVKPTDLLKYLCKLTSTPTGGVILDPFVGSGTTLVAARECGRPAIGIELEDAHCRIVVDRLRQQSLFPPAAPAGRTNG